MSRSDPFPQFSNRCKECFAFLVDRYGFSEPEEEQLGRERFIRYQKGKRTVSIAYEPGLSPIVELFFPSRDIKNRRFPRHSGCPIQGKPKQWKDERMDEFLAQSAAELERNEREFLEDGDDNGRTRRER